jgi:two-component system CheB/CheR fusion protein
LLLISVRDTGIGLAPEMITRVFDMFLQVDTHQDHSEGGLGIGLTLVKGLVELHGGRIEARSAGLGLGSEFVVSLPTLHMTTGVFQKAVSPARRKGNARRSVLIAEDNRDGAESLAMLLELAGHTIHVVHTGSAALEIAAARRPHVVILDIGMPGINGYEVAKYIRAEAWGHGSNSSRSRAGDKTTISAGPKVRALTTI